MVDRTAGIMDKESLEKKGERQAQTRHGDSVGLKKQTIHDKICSTKLGMQPKLQYSTIRMTPYLYQTPARTLDFDLEN